MMKKLDLVLSIALVIGMVLAVSCGGGAAPTTTVTVTRTAAVTTVTVTPTPGAVPTVTVTQTAAPVTLTPTKLVKVRMAEASAGTALFFDTIGVEQGFPRKRGIDLEIVTMPAAASKLAPFVGQADVGNGDTTAYYSERKDTRIIGPIFSLHWGVFVRKDSPYQSYHDLKGKKIAIVAANLSSAWVLKIGTKLEGLDLEKDFTVLYGEPAVQIGWLLKGEVEAIHIYEPHASKLLVSDGDKVRELHWLNDYYKKLTGSDWLHGGIYTTDAWVKQNPELARQVGLAYDDTLRYIYANDQVWKSDLAKKTYTLTDPREVEMVAKRLPRIVQNPPYGPAYKSALVKKAELLAQTGVLPPEAVNWYKEIILFAEPW